MIYLQKPGVIFIAVIKDVNIPLGGHDTVHEDSSGQQKDKAAVGKDYL